MNRQSIVLTYRGWLLAFLIIGLLFADAAWGASLGFISSALTEAHFIVRDPRFQWLFVFGLTVYFATFSFLRFHAIGDAWRISSPHPWVICVLIIASVTYVVNCTPSTQMLVFIACAAVSQGVAWRTALEANNATFETKNGLMVVRLFVLLLALSSLWNTNSERLYLYLHHLRQTGPWYNPNTFGLLMGMGIVLAACFLVRDFEFKTQSRANVNYGMLDERMCRVLKIAFCLFIAFFLGRGLFRSYSRGAWLGTFCGLIHLFWFGLWRISHHSNQIASSTFSNRQLSSNGDHRICNGFLSLTAIFVASGTLFLWHFQQTGWHPARRAVSVLNAADFSWHNRIAAWEGALQIMADHPWFGTGWNKPEPLYAHYYLPPKLDESAAIGMNDYFILGATLGIPALFCFGMYIWLCLMRSAECRVWNKTARELGKRDLELGWLRTVFHAGAIVLLVGFWFDGGLFNLPTASIFWILLELGALEPGHRSEDLSDKGFAIPVNA